MKRTLEHLPVIVVDDGSTDGSGAAAALAGAKVFATHDQPGQGRRPCNTGFDYAVHRGVDAVITLDADGQHDPDEIPLFIEAFRAGKGDLIIGQRHVRRDAHQEPVRQSGRLVPAGQGDGPSRFRTTRAATVCSSRPVMEQVRPTSTRFEAEVEILLRAQMAGFRLAWVPIKTIYNDKKSHFRPIQIAPSSSR